MAYLVEIVSRELDVACAVKCCLEHGCGASVEIVSLYDFAEARRRLEPPCRAALRLLREPPAPARVARLHVSQPGVGAACGGRRLLADLRGSLGRVRPRVRPASRVGRGPEAVPDDGQRAGAAHFRQRPSRPRALRGALPAFPSLPRGAGCPPRLDPGKPWIFFPENCGLAFTFEHEIEERIRTGQDREEVYRLQRECRASFQTVMKWCQRLAAMGSHELIVRPHPGPWLEPFCAAVRECFPAAAFHLILEGSVREWVLASDVVLSSYSTTLVEAAVAGKAVYIVEPDPLALMATEWHGLVQRLTTWEEFRAGCLAPDGTSRALEAWARAGLASRGDAIANLARRMLEMLAPGYPRPASVPVEILPQDMQRELHTTPMHRAALAVRQRVGRLIHGPRGWSRTPREQAKVDAWFTPDDVDARVRRWRDVLGLQSPHHWKSR